MHESAASFAALLAVGYMTACIGLIVLFPLPGHATWRACRDLVGEQSRGQPTDRADAAPEQDLNHAMGYGFHLLFLFLAWLVIALVAHAVVARYFVAAFGAAAAMAVVTQLGSYWQLGRWDPAWAISSAVAFGMALIVALVVGLPFRLARRLKDEQAAGHR